MEDIRFLLEVFPHALAGGLLIAAVCSFIGVFVILKRVVFVGVALSQVAACGVAVGLVIGIQPYLGAGVLTFITVAMLAYPFEFNRLPRDAVLGIIYVLASALSILIVSQSGFGLHEVLGLLYGDLIFTSPLDLVIILSVLVPVLVYLLVFLRPTVHTFLDREAARVLGIKTSLWEFLFFICLGLAVAVASRTAGALLIFCYLVVAPAAALLVSRRLGVVLIVSVAVAILATLTGLFMAVRYDLPTNHIVAAAACALFMLSAMPWLLLNLYKRFLG